MRPLVRQSRAIFLYLLGASFGLAGAFFAFYTIQLLYVNVFVLGATGPRQTGMYIGALAFPVATLLFGWLSWFCFRAARRARP